MLESCRNCSNRCSILEKANYQIAENPAFLSLAPSLSKVIEESKFKQFKEDLLKLIASSCKNYVGSIDRSVVDQDELQMKDETNIPWVEAWKAQK